MFEDIRVDHPLPDAEYEGHYFQTKSLAPPRGALYVLTEAGRLLRYDNRPGPDPPQGFVLGPGREEGCTEVAFEGDLIFYDLLRDDRPGHDGAGWVQYRARLTGGRVRWVRRDASEDR